MHRAIAERLVLRGDLDEADEDVFRANAWKEGKDPGDRRIEDPLLGGRPGGVGGDLDQREVALDAACLPGREVFVGSGVAAGLAVAALAPGTAPPGAGESGQRLGLPELPLTRVILHARTLRGAAAEALRALSAAYRGLGAA